MKKLIFLFAFTTILTACSSQTPEEPANQEVTEPVSQEEISSETTDSKTYQSEELGISFEYPASLGEAWENKYKEKELVALKFVDDQENPAELDLTPANYQTLVTCESVLAQGFSDDEQMPSECESISLSNNHSALLITYPGDRMSVASKELHVQTNKGVWAFSAKKTELYDTLVEIAKTIKYLG